MNQLFHTIGRCLHKQRYQFLVIEKESFMQQVGKPCLACIIFVTIANAEPGQACAVTGNISTDIRPRQQRCAAAVRFSTRDHKCARARLGGANSGTKSAASAADDDDIMGRCFLYHYFPPIGRPMGAVLFRACLIFFDNRPRTADAPPFGHAG